MAVELTSEFLREACGESKMEDIDEHTKLIIPAEALEALPNPPPMTVEEKVAALKEIKWSREWAESMCGKFTPDWDKLTPAEKDKCIEHALKNILLPRVWPT